MDYLDSSINASPQADVTVAQQTEEVTPISHLAQTVASLTVYDYLGGLAIMLIFLAIWRMITQQVEKLKSTRCANVELLERIWQMDASKIGE
jgi:hypothetical protein